MSLEQAVEAGAQEGAATELRSINKGPGRRDFNLHMTYCCLLCYFQYGHLMLQGGPAGGWGTVATPGPCGYLTTSGMTSVSP